MPMVKQRQYLCHLFAIYEEARILSNRVRVVVTEADSLAVAGATHFNRILNKAEQRLLLSLTYASFHRGSTFDNFSRLLPDVWTLHIDEILQAGALEELSAMTTNLPASVIVKQVIKLYHLLESNSCVILCGPPHSGKTTTLEILGNVLETERIRNLGSAVLRPIRSEQLFHASQKDSEESEKPSQNSPGLKKSAVKRQSKRALTISPPT
jgi:hypothetical protein